MNWISFDVEAEIARLFISLVIRSTLVWTFSDDSQNKHKKPELLEKQKS